MGAGEQVQAYMKNVAQSSKDQTPDLFDLA